jgi:hypothetical protein
MVISAQVVDRDLPTQRIETERKSLGWFITIEEGISIRVASEASHKPELEPGDKIKITIDKVQTEEKTQ